MKIIISNSGEKPIYEQISEQIKDLIATGELTPEQMLPSMRYLAKELRISVITTKRAYEDLEREGFITTVPGKGCFVAGGNLQLLREHKLKEMEYYLQKSSQSARLAGVGLQEMQEVLAVLFEEEQ